MRSCKPAGRRVGTGLSKLCSVGIETVGLCAMLPYFDSHMRLDSVSGLSGVSGVAGVLKLLLGRR
ncbi:hypothetical protein F5Y07DRAFT_383433 [Xylaria sp. FL0933]|nr:hypothetical protein F5Y07DRAFT_383433 [Xylaria sp. FL0933]